MSETLETLENNAYNLSNIQNLLSRFRNIKIDTYG